MKTNKKINSTHFLAFVVILLALMFDISSASTSVKSSNSVVVKTVVTYANSPTTSRGNNPLWYIPFTATPITYTFEVSAERWATTLFTLSVNGVSISGTESVISGSPVYVYDYNAVSNGSTVVVNVTGGSMPQQPIVIEGPFAAIEGVVSGSTITFSNVPLNNGYDSCGIIFN
ncbi:hypothetical protein HDF19_04105 [Mucilaginibacter sp. E4BP6]|uniref:hypothetical protein n=1 Tax=Mucilaginibacter sp. E4BP6 TaxID=2723089 RepID=UPI0015C8A07D|nr:hypothetical protein [Mucilaginibacter sp. E4BP6]NYE64653.1 hypothetical protein [Mucilaginibacter sp. E4BP6]